MEFWLREAFGVVKDYFLFAGGAFILFYFILKKPMWFRKVQKKMPKNKDYFRDIMYSLVSVTIFATVALVVFYFYIFVSFNLFNLLMSKERVRANKIEVKFKRFNHQS